MKIDDVYEEYINFTPLSPRTKSMYLKCYNNFWKNIIGHLDINELSYNIVQSGINFLIKKYSYNTIKIYKCAVFKFIDIAQLKNGTKYEHVKCINIGKPPKKKEFNCANELEEYYALIEYIKNSTSKLKEQYEMILWIGFFTGLRISEVLALNKNDIDLNRKEIHITKSLTVINDIIQVNNVKTPSSCRIVYIPNELRDILIEYIPKIKNKILFPNNKGDYIIPSNISSFISHFARPRKYTIHFHSLRVLYTKIMLDNNASIESVRALLGHANVSTTLNIYLRGNVEERKSDVDKVFNSKKYVKKA